MPGTSEECALMRFLKEDYDPESWHLFIDDAAHLVLAVQESAEGGWDWTTWNEDGDEDDGGQLDCPGVRCPVGNVVADVVETYAVRGVPGLVFRPYDLQEDI